jgi:hypothetical protein
MYKMIERDGVTKEAKLPSPATIQHSPRHSSTSRPRPARRNATWPRPAPMTAAGQSQTLRVTIASTNAQNGFRRTLSLQWPLFVVALFPAIRSVSKASCAPGMAFGQTRFSRTNPALTAGSATAIGQSGCGCRPMRSADAREAGRPTQVGAEGGHGTVRGRAQQGPAVWALTAGVSPPIGSSCGGQAMRRRRTDRTIRRDMLRQPISLPPPAVAIPFVSVLRRRVSEYTTRFQN